MTEKRSKSDQYLLRLPPGLRERLQEDADSHSRSLNGEIVSRLEDFPNVAKVAQQESRARAELADDKERLLWELERFKNLEERFLEKDGKLKPILSVPQPLFDRIKLAAASNHRTIDAEAQAALEKAFPAPSIDINVLSAFLESLISPFSDEPDRQDHDEYIMDINDALAKTGATWTVKSDPLGAISFYPYATPKAASDEGDEE